MMEVDFQAAHRLIPGVDREDQSQGQNHCQEKG